MVVASKTGMPVAGFWQGKWALCQALYIHAQRELIDRPKAGFGFPISHWLGSSLRPWAESFLDQNRLNFEGYFYPAPIRKKWAGYLTIQYDHTASLWAVLMFQAWLQKQ